MKADFMSIIGLYDLVGPTLDAWKYYFTNSFQANVFAKV